MSLVKLAFEKYANEVSEGDDTKTEFNANQLVPWEALLGGVGGGLLGIGAGAWTGTPKPWHAAAGAGVGYLAGAPFSLKRLGGHLSNTFDESMREQREQLEAKLQNAPEYFDDRDQRTLDYINKKLPKES